MLILNNLQTLRSCSMTMSSMFNAKNYRWFFLCAGQSAGLWQETNSSLQHILFTNQHPLMILFSTTRWGHTSSSIVPEHWHWTWVVTGRSSWVSWSLQIHYLITSSAIVRLSHLDLQRWRDHWFYVLTTVIISSLKKKDRGLLQRQLGFILVAVQRFKFK